MDYAFAVIIFYAAILGLVAPYIFVKNQEVGSLLPPAVALAAGSVLWVILTWVGLKYTDAYIWVIVMLAMPAAMIFLSTRIANQRISEREEKLRR
jgi:hypothetical protein